MVHKPSVPGIALVCMPWHVLRSPSIQIGTLQALLNRHGIACTAHSLHLQFMHFASSPGPRGERLLTPADYFEIGDRWFFCGAGEWVFARPRVGRPNRDEDHRALTRLRHSGMPSGLAKRLAALRDAVPEFLAVCADEILAGRPAMVGFTTTFGQTVASLALATVLKERAPGVKIVFGGANCEGVMGEAIHRSFDQVDFVVRGEGEPVLPALARSQLAGAPAPALPGVCYRDGGRSIAIPEAAHPALAMDDVPVPDYGEYFSRLHRLGLSESTATVLPFESSRGCWWGQKSHCTFCGMNGRMMAHRSKSPQRVIDDLVELSSRHEILDFTVTDNILDPDYFESVLPALRDRGLDLRLFWQTKANLTLAQVRLLRDAGVRCIRPGIESLSTPILKLMRKGVTALQNIRLLKWCAQHGIHVAWNVLHGLPGEPPAEYERMAQLVPWLVHLTPPQLVPLTLDRFSPYHDQPERHGVRVVGPPLHYRALYGVDAATLRDLAWTFEFEVIGDRRPSEYVAALRAAIERWRADTHRNRGALVFRRGPGFLAITDTRSSIGEHRYVLEGLEAEVYLACDEGSEPERLAAELSRRGRAVAVADLRRILADLAGAHLVYEEDGHYLALALADEELAPSAASG